MPTFKAIVRKHHQRRDGKYPVSIRVTHNRQSAYLPTGLYIEKRGINTRTFEIKDQFIIERANKTIRNYEERLLMLDTEELLQMSITALISLLRASSGRIDYFSMCEEIIAQNKEKEQALAHALNIIKNEMGIMRMYSTDFTSHFLREFKRHLDNRDIITVQKNGKETRRKMAAKTKNSYLKAVCKAFRMMCKEYNTEFVQVIKHNPFIGFELYPEPQTKRKALDVEVLRKIFNCNKKLSPLQQQTLDIMRMEFCLCGMNTKDLLTVTKGCYDAKANRISYERSKTRESAFFIPPGWLQAAATIYGIGDWIINDVAIEKNGRSLMESGKLQLRDVPILNRYYSPKNIDIYRYMIKKEASEITNRYSKVGENVGTNLVYMNDENADEYAKAIMATTQPAIKELNIQLEIYNICALTKIRNQMGGLTLKEFKEKYPNLDYRNLDKVQKEAVQEMQKLIFIIEGPRDAENKRQEWLKASGVVSDENKNQKK